MKALSIRWRLTICYGGVLCAILAAFSVAVYVMMRHGLLERTDSVVIGQLNKTVSDVEGAATIEDLINRLSARSRGHKEYNYQATALPNENVLFRSEGLGDAVLPMPSGPILSERLYQASVEPEAIGPLRVIGRVTQGPAGTLFVQTTLSTEVDRHELQELTRVLLIAGPLAVVIALVGGYVLARRALAPVDRMAAIAADISASKLDRRLSPPNPEDELGRLAKTFNGMISRLEQSFNEMKQFTADAAHELRNPLTVMRNEAEVALQSSRSPAEYRRVIENILEELDRLTRLTEQLLYLSREDAGLQPAQQIPVRLDEIARDVADHMRVLAAEKGVALHADQLQPSSVLADPDRLRRLLFNLLDNAVKYTPAGGTVWVACRNGSDQAELIVQDTGIGISAQQLPNVFNRFYRADPSRTADGAGAGLGLAISRSIVETHGGTISIDSTPGQGAEVTIRFPAKALSATATTVA